MICPSCQEANTDEAEVCFTCGKALHALTQGAMLASRYVIRQLLGRGGMGYVYRAFDRMLEEDVAIKVIRAELVREPEMARRFRSEIRLARKVSHRNVCRIHEYGEDGGLRYLSMEFVEGVDLKRLLRDGPLPHAQAFEVGIEAAEGLQAVHTHRIIHRDLKPANIMVDRAGMVRLMDFGIAKEAESEASLTGSGLIGTPEYMSPERAQGQKIGYASDVYALGCLLYETFLGVPPFHADTPLNTLYMHLHNPPPLAGREPLPELLEPVLRRALAKKPADRYTAAGLADALREVRTGLGIPAGNLASAVAAATGPQKAAASERRGDVPEAAQRPATPVQSMTTSTLGGAVGSHGPWWTAVARSSRRWRWAFGGLAGVAAAVVLASALREREALDTLPKRAVPDSLAPAASTLPLVVPATPSVQTAPSRPMPSRTSPSPRPSQEALRTPAPLTAGAATTVPARPSGTLSLLIVPPAEVTVDGESLGIVSHREVVLAAGPHAVRILHPDFKPLHRKVNIQGGLTETLVLDLSEKAIRRPQGPGN